MAEDEAILEAARTLTGMGIRVQIIRGPEGTTLIASSGTVTYEPLNGGGWWAKERMDSPENISRVIREVNAEKEE